MSSDDVDWGDYIRETRCVTPDGCAFIRDYLAGSNAEITDLADTDRFGNLDRTTLGRHARGSCQHDIDTPPVRRVVTWIAVEDDGA